jgi:hypothetical protein
MRTYEARQASEMFNLLVDDLSKPPQDAMKAISKVQHTGTAFLPNTVISAWKDGMGEDHFRAVCAD